MPRPLRGAPLPGNLNMRITALTENTSARGLPVEHGLSLFVEMENYRFLFDMGQTDLFAENAETLGIDLNAADFAVLSHGHYDHGGGLRTFLLINGHAPVYMSRYAFELHYNGTEKYIGLDQGLKASDRIVFVDEEKKISEGITIFGCHGAPKLMDFGSSGLNMIRDGRMMPEDFRHEQYLLVEERGKKILFSGCSHRGILNIMRWFRPDILIGGFHFSKLPLDETLDGYAKALDACPTVYYTGHCTGTEQYRFMKGRMKRIHYLSTGDSISI